MNNQYTGNPKRFCELPQKTQSICNSLTEMLESSLQNIVHGIYLYGAEVFPESDHVVDIDFHVILKKSLSADEKEKVRLIHKSLTDNFQSLSSDDLDGWYILLDDVQLPAPKHQVKPNLSDTAWPLHRAHMRAGYCIVLQGPEPRQVFSAPTWSELVTSLNVEQKFIMEHFAKYPAYCILNACRLMYSYTKRDVVISKRASAEWTIDNFPVWKSLINAALRWYAEDKRDDDRQLFESKTESFLKFANNIIESRKNEKRPH
jgi:hypothetical protein